MDYSIVAMNHVGQYETIKNHVYGNQTHQEQTYSGILVQRNLREDIKIDSQEKFKQRPSV